MGTALPIFEDARRQMRRPLLGELSGRLFVTEGYRPIRCLAVDVSMYGLRVMAHEELFPGTLMVLEYETHNIPLVIVWCQKDGKRSGSFACGLKTTKTTCDLIKVFTTIGWLGSIDETKEWLSSVEFIKGYEE